MKLNCITDKNIPKLKIIAILLYDRSIEIDVFRNEGFYMTL